MVFSINGNKVIDIMSSGKIFRSTHHICLNCGISAEDYGHRYCHFCFDRNNWGDITEYMEKVKENEPDIFSSPKSFCVEDWTEEEKEKIKQTQEKIEQQKIEYDSFYSKFWFAYNDTYDFFLDTYDKYFKKEEEEELKPIPFPLFKKTKVDCPQETLRQPLLGHIV